MQEPGFWDDSKKAEEVTKKSKLIKDKIENYDKLKSQLDDIEVLKDSIAGIKPEIRTLSKHHIKTEDYPTKAGRPKNSRMSKKSLDKAGFKRLPSWKNAVERYLEELDKADI